MRRRQTSGPWGLQRIGLTTPRLVAGLIVLLAIPAVAWSFLPGLGRSSDSAGPMVCQVTRGDFLYEITERGNVESASNIEVRCEVQSLNSAGTRILWIIPEGTYVTKGQEIVRLDSSALENDYTKQQIQVANSEAAVIQARSELKTAEIAKMEYLEGKYKQEEESLESEVFVAEEDYRRAVESLQFSEKLASKGYITPLQLEADKFAKDKAERSRAAVQTKLRVLREHTRRKMELQLQADIDSAKAKLDAAMHTLKLDTDRLKLIEDQIKKCTITAPADGQVVYANQTERWGGQEVIIEEGATVRERQVIVRLPDPKRMQVKARINESKIAMVVEGQPAAIRVQAYPDLELKGVVQKVNEYPAPGAWYAANIKEYEAIVKIEDSPVPLRPGLTAEVKIRVAHQPDVLQVPVQAVFEHGGRHYAVVQTPDGWEARMVEIGLTNEKYVVIRDGLAEGETVAMNAASFREAIDLPELPPGSPEAKPEGPMLARDPSVQRPEDRPGLGGAPSGAPKPGPGVQESAEPPGRPLAATPLEAKGSSAGSGNGSEASPTPVPRQKGGPRKTKPRVQAAATPPSAPS